MPSTDLWQRLAVAKNATLSRGRIAAANADVRFVLFNILQPHVAPGA
jgi:hypothetical protein